jgi:hypothetical protein
MPFKKGQNPKAKNTATNNDAYRNIEEDVDVSKITETYNVEFDRVIDGLSLLYNEMSEQCKQHSKPEETMVKCYYVMKYLDDTMGNYLKKS